MTNNELQDQIDDYLRFSQVERGLSTNTISAYRQDLEEYLSFIRKKRGCLHGQQKLVMLMPF